MEYETVDEIEAAIFDYKLPAFVRAFLALKSLNAVYQNAINEAGYMPELYGRYQGNPVRVVMVSRLGDVGINWNGEEYGYSLRCSIRQITDFALEMPR